MSKRAETSYRYKCDNPVCSCEKASTEQYGPTGWLVTNNRCEEDLLVNKRTSSGMHTIASIRDEMDFCCTDCFLQYLEEQIRRLNK